MAFKLAEAYVEFNQRGAAGVRSAVNGLGGIFSKLQTNVSGLTAGLAALGGAGVIHTLTGFVNAAGEAERQTAKLEAVLKATGNAAGLTVQELENMASALQDVTAFEDDTVKGAEAVLLTFKKIGGETFPRALEAAADLATVFETDLASAATMVGKALEDPIRGITALRRVGVSFSKDQEAVIKSLVQTGEVAKAQAAILKEIEGQVGGSARAVGDTTYGKIEQLKNAAGDAAEAIGGELAPVVMKLAEAIKVVVSMLPSNSVARIQDVQKRGTALSQSLMKAQTQEEVMRIMAKINSLRIEAPNAGRFLETTQGLFKSPGFQAWMRTLPREADQKAAEAAKREAAARDPNDPIARILRGDRIFGDMQDAVSNWERLAGGNVADLDRLEKVANAQYEVQKQQLEELKRMRGRQLENSFRDSARYE